MPTYVYKCDTCEETWEESLPYEARDLPTEGHCSLSPHLGATVPCYGTVSRVPQMPGFAYDNIPSPGHPKKTPDWMKDRLKDIKKNQPGATMNIPG